jgi:hypothetical protein
MVSINGITRPYHQVLARQYIHNPDPDIYTEVDHIDSNRLNNSIDNLRWLPLAENRNKSKCGHIKYEWFDSLPEDARPFTRYNNHTLDGIYKNLQDEFFKQYLIDGKLRYKKLYTSMNGDYRRISIADNEGRSMHIYLSKIDKELY